MNDVIRRRNHPSRPPKCLAAFSLSCKNARRLLNCCYNYFNFLWVFVSCLFIVFFFFLHFCLVVGHCCAIVAAVIAASSFCWVFGFGFWLSLFASLVDVVLLLLLLHLAFIIIVNRI